MPQEFAPEEQELPYPAGLAGALTLQDPFTTVPEFDWPQEFEAEHGTEQSLVP